MCHLPTAHQNAPKPTSPTSLLGRSCDVDHARWWSEPTVHGARFPLPAKFDVRSPRPFDAHSNHREQMCSDEHYGTRHSGIKTYGVSLDSRGVLRCDDHAVGLRRRRKDCEQNEKEGHAHCVENVTE